ncbi:MAG TPA: dienelactone hydrolase family protein, partial [Candidatus Hodarchaeales archaeon]|nr:dienelactone hydrolase family protein [Candidatus Hodarchaeales archaeon]
LSRKEVTTKTAGTVGFCMGGQLSFTAACLNPDVGACVIFYGIHPKIKPKIENLRAKVLGFFGAKDKGVPVDSVKKLEADLKAAGKSVDFTIFPDCDHAFFNDTRKEVYNQARAMESWTKMVKFFRENLK